MTYADTSKTSANMNQTLTKAQGHKGLQTAVQLHTVHHMTRLGGIKSAIETTDCSS